MKNLIVSSVYGFCDGVECALKKICNIRAETAGKIYVDGELVHNEIVNRDLAEQGIFFVKNDNDFLQLQQNDTIVIRAHGVSPERRNFLKSFGTIIVDATCRHVAKIAAIIRKNSDRVTVILGDKNHAEVVGLLGYSHENYVCSDLNDFEKFCAHNINVNKKYLVICQSTFDIDLAAKAGDFINDFSEKFHLKYGSRLDIVFENTICDATKLRQKSLKEFENCEIVIVVGSKISANSCHLCEKICKKNKICYLIENISDVNKLDSNSFCNAKNIGLTSAASVPKLLVENVKNAICEKFCLKLKKI